MSLLDQLPEPDVVEWRAPKSGWEPISITDAYKALTCRAFNVWIRLHLFLPGQLKIGRVRLSRALKISEPTFNRVVRELSDKGYVEVESRAHKNRSTVRLSLRARTGGHNAFINV
jgi:hypothetical protein